MNQPEQDRMIQDTHDKVNLIYTAIFGVEGKGGCVAKCDKVSKDFYNLRLGLAFILGGSVLTAGGIEIAKILAGQ